MVPRTTAADCPPLIRPLPVIMVSVSLSYVIPMPIAHRLRLVPVVFVKLSFVALMQTVLQDSLINSICTL